MGFGVVPPEPVADLLARASAAGLAVAAEGDRLVVRGPRDSEALARAVLARKTEVWPLLTSLAAGPGWDQPRADAALAAVLARCALAALDDARTDGQRRAVDAYRVAGRGLADRRDPYLFAVLPDLERAFARWRLSRKE